MPSPRLPILAALILAAPASLRAQDNGVIGSPDLRDFSLPGTRTTPPAVVEPAVPPPSPVTQPAERPPAQPQRQARALAPPSQAPAPETEPQSAPVAAADAEAIPTSSPAPELTPAPQPQPLPPVEASRSAPKTTFSIPDWGWWAGGAGVLALLAIIALLRRRRREELAYVAEESPTTPLPPAPVPVPAPPLPAAPQIEVEFRPERLATTDTQAAVHFDLVLRNIGAAEAKNLRIEARLFSASGAEVADVTAYLSEALDPAIAAAGLNIPPGRGVALTSSVTIPRDRIRLVEMAGRPLFIPTVAIKIAHEAESGAQHIVRQYLVGIEPKQPGGKIGPFRMDIGPRIYRALDQRLIEAPAPQSRQRGRVTLR